MNQKMFIIPVLLAALFLAGCGNDNSSSSSSDSSSSSTSDSSSTSEAEGYLVSFSCDSNVSVKVYASQDYTSEPTAMDSTYSVDADSGEKTKSGDGQVNFLLVFESGYEIDSISIEGTYSNLKGYSDTGVDNVYRITKIASDLTVSIVSKVTPAVVDAYNITFNVGEHASVYVYDSQDYTTRPSAASTSAYSWNKDTNSYSKTDGQVNFEIVCDSGYECDLAIAYSTSAWKSDAVSGSYNNIKIVGDNIYRVTVIASDLIIGVTPTVKPTTPDAFKVRFILDSNTNVKILSTQSDATGTALVSPYVTYSVSGDVADAYLRDGNGQINFLVSSNSGYSFTFAEDNINGMYNKLKVVTAGSSYRITKITSDIVIYINSVAA